MRNFGLFTYNYEGMIVLVDYDNLSLAYTRLGVEYAVEKIISRLSPNEISSGKNILIRLYGGWYENQSFTLRAQKLSAEVSAKFPTVYNLSDNKTSVVVNCEMAYSLLADPTNHLFHTFRQRGIPSGLKASHPNKIGCAIATCPIVATYDFLRKNQCDHCKTVKPEDVFYRGEQKLVDTMLTADLIFSSFKNSELCIVSSDDDFWPGIMTTLNTGKRVIHIQTRNRFTPAIYTKNAGKNYVSKIL